MTKQKVLQLAKQFNVKPEFKIDKLGDSNEITILAPDGKVWACRYVHEIVICGEIGVTWKELYSEAVEDMSMGLKDCDDVNCEWCD